jgi:hypothetical protein
VVEVVDQLDDIGVTRRSERQLAEVQKIGCRTENTTQIEDKTVNRTEQNRTEQKQTDAVPRDEVEVTPQAVRIRRVADKRIQKIV